METIIIVVNGVALSCCDMLMDGQIYTIWNEL
jgi:hypothetical protein